MIRSLLPTWLKLCIRHCINLVKDVRNGYLFSYAKKGKESPQFTECIPLNQNLRPNDAKLHNLRIAIAAIEEVIIQPREIFSFWKVVGKPSKKNGFVESRSILGNQITPTVGGGLCQLSGLLYYVSLMSGLEILERHNHSMDIYNDDTRFTPLGSDATVAYAYKDLKIRNNSSKPIGFTFQISDEELGIILNHSGHLKSQKVDFKSRLIHPTIIEVDTIIEEKIVVTSSYQKPSSVY